MKRVKLTIILFILFTLYTLFGNNTMCTVYAAGNPYPSQQNVDKDAYYEVPCTWFAWQQVYDNTGIALPAWGNAVNWWQNAINAGYSTGSTPKAGAIAVWSGDTYGHVAYVTSGSGSTFTVNEGGRTDLDHTSSHGVAYGYTLTNAVGGARPYDSGKRLLGFIYPSGSTSVQLWGINENDTFSGQAKLWAKRGDSDPNHYAIWYIDDVAITGHTNSDSSGFFSVNVDTTKYSNGTHKLSIYYVNTGAGYWDVRHINFSNPILLWDINENDTFSGQAQLLAKRGDSDPNHYAIWYIDDVAITGHTNSDSRGFFSVNVDTTKYSNGTHKLSIYYVNTGAGYWDVKHININNDIHTHSYSESVTKQPTCTQTGVKTFTCSCGASYTETVNANGHSYRQSVVAPTLTDRGYTLHVCSVCGDSYKDSYVEPPVTTEPGTEGPGTTEPDQNSTEFTYEINSDGSTITITKCVSSDTDIVIPDEIDGYAVTEIGANAFENVTSMTSVSFPASLTKIGDYAFAGCTSLSTVTLPDTLSELGNYAFKDCTALTSAVINQGRKNITTGLFYGCSSLSSVTMSDSVSYIREGAFFGCTALKNLNIPKSIIIVYKNAFLNSGIKSVRYAKTSSDWKKITIYATGNSAFLNAVVTGSDGKTFYADKNKWKASSSSSNSVSIPWVSKVTSLKAKAKKKKLKLSWNQVHEASGYEIAIDSTKYFFGPKTIYVSGGKRTYTKKGLKAKRKYYVKIRAYKTYRDARGNVQKAYGSWSRVCSKKTK